MRNMKIEQLSIRTKTNDGMYGVDIPFKSGLNIIHAENTHGKSTCIQSIIFALGLEGCLGPSRKVPLKTALTSQLRKSNGGMASIFESNIYLQINNGIDTITLMRSSKLEKKDLISVFHGVNTVKAISGEAKSSDYFLRLEGSATRERGFHFFLSEFLGIVQPKVLKFDGSETLLYLESIFSINYVEQTRGWGGILNIIPTYLGIKDLSARIIEYTLNLDVQDTVKKRQELNNKKKDSERIWNIALDNLIALAKSTSGFVSVELDEKITNKTQVSNNSYLYYQTGDEKNSYRDQIERLNSELLLLKARKINNNIDEKKVARLQNELKSSSDLLLEQERAVALLISDLDLSQKYTNSIEIRIHGVNDSLRKYRDLQRLESIGSEEEFNISSDHCPACHTELDDSLLSHELHESSKILGLESNIKYLEKQRDTFDSILKGERRNTASKEIRFEMAKRNISLTRTLIREIKSSLIDEKSTPSRSDIKRELLTEYEIESLTEALSTEEELKRKLEESLRQWKLANSSLQAMPQNGFSTEDWKKINSLRQSFILYLKDFGYSSNDLDDFQISKQSYKPTLNDVDLNSEASASDNIRVIWSYLYSMLTLDQKQGAGSTNHLGLLIMDEPRQQEAKNESFKEFIYRAAEVKAMNKQVIIGTSEELIDLQNTIQGLDVSLNHFSSDIIKKLN
jgi:hypothetical protein